MTLVCRRLPFFLFAFLSTLLASPMEVRSLPPVQPLPPTQAIVDQFAAVVFGREHQPSPGVISRWEEAPDLVFFRESGYDLTPHLPSIERHLRALSSLTGLQVTASNDLETGTLRLGFLPVASFTKLARPEASPPFLDYLRNSACIAISFNDPDRDGLIEKGMIVIGTDISDRTRAHCLLEEMVQVLGLPNDACLYRPSLFCEDDYLTEMTTADRILVRALYDSRLSPGLRREDALETVNDIVHELVRAAEIL